MQVRTHCASLWHRLTGVPFKKVLGDSLLRSLRDQISQHLIFAVARRSDAVLRGFLFVGMLQMVVLVLVCCCVGTGIGVRKGGPFGGESSLAYLALFAW